MMLRLPAALEAALAIAVATGAMLTAAMLTAAMAQSGQASPWPASPQQSAAPAGQASAGQASPWPSSPQAPAQASPWPSSTQPTTALPAAPGASPFGAPPPQQMPSQCTPFQKLRDDAAQKANAVSEIGKKHGDRAAMCGAVTRFFDAEQKVVKFLEENRVACGVPAEAIQQAKVIHGNTLKFKDNVCAEGPKPKIPTLSDAIGTTPLDTPKNTKTGPGTFNTLTGNPLGNN